MKRIILICIIFFYLSNDILSQEVFSEETLPIKILSEKIYSQPFVSQEIEVTVLGLGRSPKLNFSSEDSLMINDIKQKILDYEEGFIKKIRYLDTSMYSQNAIRYAYRLYANHINDITNRNLVFLKYHGLSDGLFIPMSHTRGYVYGNNPSSPIKDEFFRIQMSYYLARNSILSDCDYFIYKEFPYYFNLNKAYKERVDEINKEIFYESIGSILARNVELIKFRLEKEASEYNCMQHNIDLLIEFSETFRKAWEEE